jgi:hypothetical protein
MFKTVSAALLVASIFVAPAMAAGIGKTDVAPITKSEKATPNAVSVNAQKSKALSAKALNAKASMRTTYNHHHSHKHFASAKTHAKTHKIAHAGKTRRDLKQVSAIKPAGHKA